MSLDDWVLVETPAGTVRTRRTAINGRWELFLPEHRHARPEWPWWEATRLAAEHHVITHVLEGTGDPIWGLRRPVVWCVGAEEGDFPALYSTWGADVVLAEPNPLVWPNIKAIWDANNLRAPLACVFGFLADEDRDPVLHEHWPESAGGPVIGDHGFCRVEERPDLPARRIDTLVAEGLPAPDVITIDVEGAELHVIKGAAETLREHRPHVFISIHDEFAQHHYGIDYVLGDIRIELAAAGYTLDAEHEHYLCTDHEAHWWWAP